uniref:CUE domain-containing protein n=1 Tax=Capra hircus TaxID=9925 RepID=A0A8C2RC26_CAPHI
MPNYSLPSKKWPPREPVQNPETNETGSRSPAHLWAIALLKNGHHSASGSEPLWAPPLISLVGLGACELHRAGQVAGGARRSSRGESMELERIVSAALLAFVQTHLPEADLSGLDDVIFSYVLGVLGDLGPSGPSEENFDMEAFTEMMEAYVPGFAHIPRGTVGDMIQTLSGQLSGARNKENVQPQSSEVQGQVSISPEPLQRPEKLKEEMMSSAGDTQDEAAGPEEELLPGVDVLLEVFPTCSVEQAQWVLAKARGDLEEAVQMLVEGKQGPPAWDGPNQDLPRRLRGPQKDELKSFILQKYMSAQACRHGSMHVCRQCWHDCTDVELCMWAGTGLEASAVKRHVAGVFACRCSHICTRQCWT